MRRRKKNGLTNVLVVLGAVIGGAFFSKQIKDLLSKVPVIKDMEWVKGSTNA